MSADSRPRIQRIARLWLCAMWFAAPCFAVDAGHPAEKQALALDAPNPVVISPRLITSGQPTPQALSKLSEHAIEGVIYLAPPTVDDAVRDEPERLKAQRIRYVNIPIVFNNPTDKDFDQFVETMAAFGDRKLLVHCQINLRASSMVFLYRAIIGKENPAKAFESVSRVWVPNPVWKKFIQAQLKRHMIAFEIL